MAKEFGNEKPVTKKTKMKQRACILYSGMHGQTRKISEELQKTLRKNGFEPEIYSIEDYQKDIADFDVLIIGAAVRYGKHNEAVQQFIQINKKEFSKINTAFFSVNLVARKRERSSPETNPYFIKFMETVDWKPDLSAVFAGKLDYSLYPFFDRLMIKMIMKFTQGPTKTKEAIEYTNWEKVREFGELISTSFKDKDRSENPNFQVVR